MNKLIGVRIEVDILLSEHIKQDDYQQKLNDLENKIANSIKDDDTLFIGGRGKFIREGELI